MTFKKKRGGSGITVHYSAERGEARRRVILSMNNIASLFDGARTIKYQRTVMMEERKHSQSRADKRLRRPRGSVGKPKTRARKHNDCHSVARKIDAIGAARENSAKPIAGSADVPPRYSISS